MYLCPWAFLFTNVTIAPLAFAGGGVLLCAILLLGLSGFISASEVAFFSLTSEERGQLSEGAHPSDRKILGLEEGSGLYEVLTREARLGDVLLTGKDMEMDEEFKFCFLPGGKAAEDGSRLLGSERMQKVIEAVQEKVDYVILDSAPAGLLTDAGVLAQYADSAIFVIRRDFASTTHIMEGLEELSESRVHLIGGILNGV